LPVPPEPVFCVNVFGTFGPEQVRIVWRDEPRPAHAALDAMVARTWARRMEEARLKGQMLFNGPLARYLRHRVEDDTLAIEVGPTDYANFLGTNFCNPNRADEFGWELYGNPVGTTATVIAADGWLMYGRRNQRVACHGGYIHTLGGGLEAGERDADGCFDGFESVRRELDEELGLKAEDITEMVCLGLIRDLTIRQPELIFDVRVRQERAELEARIDPSDPEQEHEALVAVRDTPAAIETFVATAERIAPVAVGAVLQHGRRYFGEDWYRAAVASWVG